MSKVASMLPDWSATVARGQASVDVLSERWFPTRRLTQAKRFARRVEGELLAVAGGWLVRWNSSP
jgi:hypothetical protein